MNFLKKISIFFLFLIINLSVAFCFEQIESLHKRIEISKQIYKISNNTIKLHANEKEGLSCVTNDYISERQVLMKIPKEYSLCSSDLFPFKLEIIKILREIPILNENIGKNIEIPTILLSYYLLYYMYAPKEKVKRYISEKKLSQYFNVEESHDTLRYYFPNIMTGSALLDIDQFNLVRNLGYTFDFDVVLEEVFKKIIEKVMQLDYKDLILPWIRDYEQLKWAFSIVQSRSFTIKNQYVKLYNENTNFNESISMKKNNEINKLISPADTGATCLIAFVDLINHYHPKYHNKKPYIFLNFENGNFIYYANKDMNPGEEIVHIYIDNTPNLVLFFNYGFVIPDNIFNTKSINVEDNSKLNLSGLEICQKINCFELNENDKNLWKIPESRSYDLSLTKLNANLINYGRVISLNKKFDKSIILKRFYSEEIISNENEIMAWTYYYLSLQKIDKINNSKNISLENSVNKCQKYRNKVKNIELNWINQQTKGEIWKNNKIYENIYLLDISYKKIINRHILGSINKLILNTFNEIEKLKNNF